MSRGGANAIGLLVEKFIELLEWLIEPKKKTEIEELLEMDTYLKLKFNLSIKEITEFDFEKIAAKLRKIEVSVLDNLILLIFRCAENKNEPNFFTKLNRRNLNVRLMELIEFVEENNNNFSLERNNLKNSLQHY